MRFFSKIAFICNLGFIAFVILGYVEFTQKKAGIQDNIIPLPVVTGSLVVLGVMAVFINLIFAATVLYYLVKKTQFPAPAWIVVANCLLLLVQLFYFFIL